MLGLEAGGDGAAELVRAAEGAAAQSIALGETITGQHAQLRAQQQASAGAASAGAVGLGAGAQQLYAESMATLAQEHWAAEEAGSGGGRIEWCAETAHAFFGLGAAGAQKRAASPSADGGGGAAKRPRVGDSAAAEGKPDGDAPTAASECPQLEGRRLRLLDVGSCYDPFRRYASLEVTAFDLCPAPANADTVYTADLLALDLAPPCDHSAEWSHMLLSLYMVAVLTGAVLCVSGARRRRHACRRPPRRRCPRSPAAASTWCACASCCPTSHSRCSGRRRCGGRGSCCGREGCSSSSPHTPPTDVRLPSKPQAKPCLLLPSALPNAASFGLFFKCVGGSDPAGCGVCTSVELDVASDPVGVAHSPRRTRYVLITPRSGQCNVCLLVSWCQCGWCVWDQG